MNRNFGPKMCVCIKIYTRHLLKSGTSIFKFGVSFLGKNLGKHCLDSGFLGGQTLKLRASTEMILDSFKLNELGTVTLVLCLSLEYNSAESVEPSGHLERSSNGF